ncbi:MAG: ImmA/IrrE family metallo-endopeptidase [Ktedonobacteraceae bacterium]
MSDNLKEEIIRSRMLLQNPYAFLNGEGAYEALPNCSSLELRITQSRLLLEDPYAYIDGNGGFDVVRRKGGQAISSFWIDLDQLRNPDLIGRRVSFEKIEEITRRLQKAIWNNRKAIWGNCVPEDPVEVLDPSVAFRLIGYDFRVDDRLGQLFTAEGVVEVAGFIDESERFAGVSSRLPLTVSQFTAAHELGHAVLHPAAGLHRDRALDGSPVSGPRDRIEVEADKFAAYFENACKTGEIRVQGKVRVNPVCG